MVGRGSGSFVELGVESVSFLAQFDKGGEGGFAFGGFFTFALTAREFDAIMMDGAFKEAVVVGTSGRNDMILGRLGGNGLKEFLKFALGILECRNHRERADRAVKLAQDEFTGGIETAIEGNRTEQRCKSICGSGGTIAATG